MSTADYSPDGLTEDDITALQREVTAELRREGHLPPPRRTRRRTAASRPRATARAQITRSPREPAARRDQGRGDHQ
ncbi:hypothetical protein GCM10010174_52590 [Kutzneria viridogrisea]|uniref:Uncharacterized protein n=1 Tax=Kutzneria viridogrisea TaxID=47990 RepID=A0ABR6BK36_9PSEU|nr:hypothetical protein [Kutzneria viridogrisea]